MGFPNQVAHDGGKIDKYFKSYSQAKCYFLVGIKEKNKTKQTQTKPKSIEGESKGIKSITNM